MIAFANGHNFIVVHWHQALLVVARDDAFACAGSRRRARHLKGQVRTESTSSFMIWTVFMEEVAFARPKHTTGFEVLSTRSAQDMRLRRRLII